MELIDVRLLVQPLQQAGSEATANRHGVAGSVRHADKKEAARSVVDPADERSIRNDNRGNEHESNSAAAEDRQVLYGDGRRQ